jgi:hypothetical protein
VTKEGFKSSIKSFEDLAISYLLITDEVKIKEHDDYKI